MPTIKIDLTTEIRQLHNKQPVNLGGLDQNVLAQVLAKAAVLRGDLPQMPGWDPNINADTVVDDLAELAKKQVPITIGDVLMEALVFVEPDAKDEKKAKAPMGRQERRRRNKTMRRIEDEDTLECDDTTVDWLLELVEARYGTFTGVGQVILARATEYLDDALEAAEAALEAPAADGGQDTKAATEGDSEAAAQ